MKLFKNFAAKWDFPLWWRLAVCVANIWDKWIPWMFVEQFFVVKSLFKIDTLLGVTPLLARKNGMALLRYKFCGQTNYLNCWKLRREPRTSRTLNVPWKVIDVLCPYSLGCYGYTRFNDWLKECLVDKVVYYNLYSIIIVLILLLNLNPLILISLTAKIRCTMYSPTALYLYIPGTLCVTLHPQNELTRPAWRSWGT